MAQRSRAGFTSSSGTSSTSSGNTSSGTSSSKNKTTYTGTSSSSSNSGNSSSSSGAKNISQYYSGKGSKLGTSVQARFADPNFASAAQRAGISQNDYAINKGNASYNQRILAQLQGGEQPAPQQPMTAPQQTLGDAFGTQETQSPYKRFSYDVGDNPYAELGSMFKQEANQKVDEDKIRRETLARFRDQMSGTDQAYNQMYQEAQQRGKGDVGSGTAILAARGLAGSQRGEAIAQGIQSANSQRENAILAAKASALADISNMAEQQAQQLISGKQAARQQGYANYVDYLAKESTINENNRKNILQALLSQGIDPNEIDPNEFNKIASKVRTTGDILKGEYSAMKAAQDAAAAEAEAKMIKDRSFQLSEGGAYYEYNPATGKTEMIASRAKTYEPKGGSVGKFINSPYGTTDYIVGTLANSSGGKEITGDQENRLYKASQALGMVQGLQDSLFTYDAAGNVVTQKKDANSVIKKNTGPLKGIIASKDPFDVKAKQIEAQMRGLIPTLARGIYGEVGVLTDADIKNYAGTVAKLTNTEEVNAALLTLTQKTILNSYEKSLLSLANSGRDVSGYSDQYNATKQQVENNLKSLGIVSETLENDGTKPAVTYTQGADGNYYPVTKQAFNTAGNASVSIPQQSRLAYVNNNPGNLRFAGQKGAAQGQGGFARFNSPEEGYNALKRQIQLDAGRGHTLASFINKYAPPTENDTRGYISNVSSSTGISPNTPLSATDLEQVARAVARQESSSNIA